MAQRWAALVAAGGLVIGLGLVTASPGGAGDESVDLSIAKSKHGPFKGQGVIDNTNLPDNPQVKSRKLHPGDRRSFWVKVKNTNEMTVDADLGGNSSGEGGIVVTFILNGEDVTTGMNTGTPCASVELEPGAKELVKMKIKARQSADPGPSLAFVTTLFNDCMASGDDTVWGRAKII